MKASETTNYTCQECGQIVYTEKYHPIECCESFKAGQEEERDSWLRKTEPEKARDNFTKDIILRTRAQAIKEVVEWVEQQGGLVSFIGMHYDDEWQAFKKERGL